jgi:hypothetical protein
MKISRYKLFLSLLIIGALLLQACGLGVYKSFGKGPFPAVIVLGDTASERALWQLVEMPRESRLDEGAQREKRVLGSNVL